MRHQSLTRLLLVVMLLISLTAVGCGKKEQPAPEVTPPANQASDAVPNDQETQPPADAETTPEPKPEQPKSGTPAADTKPFAYDEVADVFYYTEASLTDTFGKPQKVSSETDSGLDAIEYDYGDMEFKLAAFDTESAPSVYEAELENDKVPAPRGITIGDSLTDVAAKFPQTSEETITEGDDTYKMLYGTFEYMGAYGYIEYDSDGKADKFMFAHEGVGMEIDLHNDKVSGYRYFVTTN